MHADEANQAVKLGHLLETGDYRYDPQEHHGPTLYALAAIPARLRGQASLAALTESTLRFLPACFGVATILLVWAVARPMGSRVALTAAAFVAVSPPAVYYSRYFGQETLLVGFAWASLLCAQNYWRSDRRSWAVAAGVFAGLAQATKETAPIFGFAAIAALAVSAGRMGLGRSRSRRFRDTLWASGAGLLVAAIIYSWGFRQVRGLRDALAAYGPGFRRAVAGSSGQEKSAGYYAELFTFHRREGLIWDQSLFLALAVAGGLLAFAGRRLGRWLAIYTALTFLIFSALPYKTPWMAVNFVPGFAILAALALARLRARWAAPLTAVVCLGLVWQTWLAAFQFSGSPRNPLAYMHTSPDMLKVPALAAGAAVGPIKVIGEEYWPLPWYLRRRPDVGYWRAPPADCDGSLVLVGAELADAVRPRLHGKYDESYLGLRPGYVLVVFRRR